MHYVRNIHPVLLSLSRKGYDFIIKEKLQSSAGIPLAPTQTSQGRRVWIGALGRWRGLEVVPLFMLKIGHTTLIPGRGKYQFVIIIFRQAGNSITLVLTRQTLINLRIRN